MLIIRENVQRSEGNGYMKSLLYAQFSHKLEGSLETEIFTHKKKIKLRKYSPTHFINMPTDLQ